MAKKDLTKKTPIKRNSNLARRQKQTEMRWYYEYWVNLVSKKRPNDAQAKRRRRERYESFQMERQAAYLPCYRDGGYVVG